MGGHDTDQGYMAMFANLQIYVPISAHWKVKTHIDIRRYNVDLFKV